MVDQHTKALIGAAARAVGLASDGGGDHHGQRQIHRARRRVGGRPRRGNRCCYHAGGGVGRRYRVRSSGGSTGTAGATGTNGTSESEATSTSTGTTTDPTGTSTAAGTEREGASRPESGAVDTTTSGTSASTDALVRQALPGMVNATGGAQSSKKSSSDTSAKGDEAAEVSTEDSTLPKLVADSTATNPEAPAAAKAPVTGQRGGSDNNQRPVDKPIGAPRVEANTVTATVGAAPSQPEPSGPAATVVDVAVNQPAAPQAVTAGTASAFSVPQTNLAEPSKPCRPRPPNPAPLRRWAGVCWGAGVGGFGAVGPR